METYLLFDCCKIISGHTRSMILDTQRKAFYFIPNAMAAFISANGIIQGNAENAELLAFLLEEELAFPCTAPLLDQFISPKNSVWDYPARISNAIISNVDFAEVFLNDIVTQLTEILQCKYIEFRFSRPMPLETIRHVTAFISRFNLLGFSLCICLEGRIAKEELQNVLAGNTRLFKTIVFNYSEDDLLKAGSGNYGNIFFTGAGNPDLSCGIVSDALFTLHSSHYYESLAHNTCLNRKLAIDAEGNIKNCPAMAKSYGNVKDTALLSIVQGSEFQKMWHIKKDDISKCRDCEFRHICTDCRAFTEDPGDIYSKPLKCGYDPYTGVWQEWSALPFKQTAIAFYGMQELTGLKNAAH